MFQLTKALIRKFVVLLFLIMKSVSVSRRFRYTHLSILRRCITNVAGKGYTPKQTNSIRNIRKRIPLRKLLQNGHTSRNSPKRVHCKQNLQTVQYKNTTWNGTPQEHLLKGYSTETAPQRIHHRKTPWKCTPQKRITKRHTWRPPPQRVQRKNTFQKGAPQKHLKGCTIKTSPEMVHLRNISWKGIPRKKEGKKWKGTLQEHLLKGYTLKIPHEMVHQKSTSWKGTPQKHLLKGYTPKVPAQRICQNGHE